MLGSLVQVICSARGMGATVTGAEGAFKCSWPIPDALARTTVDGQIGR